MVSYTDIAGLGRCSLYVGSCLGIFEREAAGNLITINYNELQLIMLRSKCS